MAYAAQRQPPIRPPRLLSWIVSLGFHASLLAGLIYLWPHLRPITAELSPSPDHIVLESSPIELVEEADLTVAASNISPQTIETETNPLAIAPSKVEPPISPPQNPSSTIEQPQHIQLHTAISSGETGQTTGQATLRVFGNEASGKKFVFLFDRSISMEGLPLQAAKAQLLSGLNALETNHQFQIIFFNHEPLLWNFPTKNPQLVNATVAHRQLAKKFVEGIAAYGGTYRRSALLHALNLRADVIYFLTDADAPMAGSDILESVRLARQTGTAIHTIEFGILPNPTRKNFLKQLARYSGGQYVYIDINELNSLQQ